MDRIIVHPGALPLDTDVLRAEQNTMVSIAALSEAVMGTATVANGFTCLPTVPATNTVNISGGSVYQQTQLESSAYSSLPPDARQIVKQGVALDATTLTLSPPPTVGYAVNVLIQVQYADVDSDPLVRPYLNAANPSQPFSGPGNTNVAEAQTRKGTVQIAPKYGVAANSGTQSTPNPDAGWIGLFVITLAYGQTQITSGNILPYIAAPTILAKLPRIPQDIQISTWSSYFDTSSTPNLITGNPVPALAAYTNGTQLNVFVGNTNNGPVTIRMPNLPDRTLVRQNGTPLNTNDIVRSTWIRIQDDGTQWRIAGLAQGEVPRNVSSPILYVRTDGNDATADGSANSAAKAFATVAAAFAYGSTYLSLSGTALVLQLGIPGTYPFTGIRPNVPVVIQGDLANQNNYILQGNIGIGGSSGCDFKGLTIQNTSPTGTCLITNGNTNVACLNVTFTTTVTMSGPHISAGPGTTVNVQAGCQFSGNSGYLAYTIGGTINFVSAVTVVGSPNYAGATLGVIACGQIIIVPGVVFNGNATGARYLATINGVIVTYGSGVSIPGNTAGSTATGGQYV